MTDDWENMMDFADELLKHAEMHQQNNNLTLRHYVSERISIVHFDHALELLMKAYLMKKEYLICKPKKSFKNGIKKSADIAEILDENKTLDFHDLIDLFFKISEISNDDSKKSKIKKFHRLRNEIQHRSLVGPAEDKTHYLRDIKPVIHSVYENAFENRQYPLNSNTN